MKSLISVFLLVFASSTLADIAVVNVFEPLAGKAPLTGEYFREAKAIHEAAGARVAISNDLKGIYRYAMLFDDWESYGTFVQSLPSNQSWQAFQQKIARNPSAVQIDNLQLNLAAEGSGVGGPGTVTDVTVWELTDGTMASLMEGGMGAKPIHERAGASVTIYTAPGRMYYLLQFQSFEAWGRFRDTPNAEFSAYMQSISAGPNASENAVVVERNTLIAM